MNYDEILKESHKVKEKIVPKKTITTLIGVSNTKTYSLSELVRIWDRDRLGRPSLDSTAGFLGLLQDSEQL